MPTRPGQPLPPLLEQDRIGSAGGSGQRARCFRQEAHRALVELDLEGNELPGDGGAHAMGGEWVGADGRWVKAPPPEEEPASGDDAEEQGEGVESVDG